MSSSPYRRVTVKIENVNLAMVLATDIQYIRFKSCGKYLCTLYKCMGVCLQILQTNLLKVEFQRIRTKISCCLLPTCEDNDDNWTPTTHTEHIKESFF